MPAKVDALQSVPVRDAVAILRRGGLVAFPTETVYGLGADASNPDAVARIYQVKGRPAGHPVIVHIGDIGQLARWARDVPEAATKLATHFWPGPLTLVLRRAPNVDSQLSGGQDTIGLRVPGHPVALQLLREFGGGIAAPSANRFGRISPTTAEHVRSDLASEVELILDGGACEIGIESTIVDLSRGRPVLLRPGRIAAGDIAAQLGVAPLARDSAAPRAPGELAAHYAPRQPLRLIASDRWERSVQGSSRGRGVLSFRSAPEGDMSAMWIEGPREPWRYGHDLYANLRALDSSGCDRILVEGPPDTLEWAAIRDRLTRAGSV
ncbi:MAG: threonylcarbamoyl-AMP synthase [Betaproteobacteria bacterium]|nr:MAG: threonylcarbamoyl-AMP synthase [Betaproteobacteria bacterium]